MVKIGDIVDYVVQLRLGDTAVRPALVTAVYEQDRVGVQVFANSDHYGNGGDFVPGNFWMDNVRRDGTQPNTWKERESAEVQGEAVQELSADNLQAIEALIENLLTVKLEEQSRGVTLDPNALEGGQTEVIDTTQIPKTTRTKKES